MLIAIEVVASAEEYDYVFDRSGDYTFLYADERLDISNLVLEELGIEVQQGGPLNTPAGRPAEQGGRAGQEN